MSSETTARPAPAIRFDDGAAYEAMMGVWSRLVGEPFLAWVAAPAARRWIDVGCGNGAFTELIVSHGAPAGIDGIDVSAAQIAYARQRPAARLARFQAADAQALPFADASFDVAVMALVIFFLPDPAKGAAEMRRVLASGGQAAAYVWDLGAAASPIDPIRQAMRDLGLAPFVPPSGAASDAERLASLWRQAGFVDVELRSFDVERTFDDFESFWQVTLAGSILGPQVAALEAAAAEALKQKVRERLSPGGASVTYRARANAVKGRVPG